MDVSDWTLVSRNFADERTKLRITPKGSALEYHPLLPNGRLREVAEAKKKANEPPPPAPKASSGAAAPPPPPQPAMDDPLSMARTKVDMDEDPLAAMMGSGGGGGAPIALGEDPLSFMASPAPAKSSPSPSSSSSSSGGTGKGDDYGYGSPASASSSSPSPMSSLANLKADADRTTLLNGASWEVQKKMILREYSVTGNIKIGASFMKDAEFDESGGSGKTVDRTKGRLEQLEKDNRGARGASSSDGPSSGGGQQATSVEMSQKEYTQNIENLHGSLQRAWAADEKVQSLKISIKCAKMLGDTKFPQFYPRMFVMLTEILDSFGDLVFQRILAKAAEGPQGVKLNPKQPFSAADVPAEAKETCRNWFYKTACIRDLLPRLYLEVALLRCYRFLLSDDTKEWPKLMGRLGSLVRGIGDPLVAVYARCYLVRAGERIDQEVAQTAALSMSVSSSASGGGKGDPAAAAAALMGGDGVVGKAYALGLLSDYLFSFQEFATRKGLKGSSSGSSAGPEKGNTGDQTGDQTGVGEGKKVGDDSAYQEWARLHGPAVEWLVRRVARGASQEVFQQVLHKYNAHCKASLVLKCIVLYFDASLYASKAHAMVTLCKQASEVGLVSTTSLLGALGTKLASCPPPEAQRLPVLNEVWKVVRKCEDLEEYVQAATTWLDVLLRHYSEQEVLVLLADLGQHVSAAQAIAAKSPTSLLGAGSSNADSAADDKGGEEKEEKEEKGIGDATLKAAKAAQKSLVSVSRHLEHFVASLIAHSVSGSSGSQATSPKGGGGVAGGGGLVSILTSEHLHKLLDTFKATRKVEVCKELLGAVAGKRRLGHGLNNQGLGQQGQDLTTANPILINTLFDMARSLHDSIDAMSSAGERRLISGLVCSFVGLVDFKKDLEQHLNLLVECRAAFPNLDSVVDLLVMSVAGLAMKAHKLMKGKHTKRTSSFSKACLAYCHVTAPSVTQPLRRFELMLHCGQVALVNNCLPQTDAFLKAAISLIPELPTELGGGDSETEFEGKSQAQKTEVRLTDLLLKFSGLLVVVPGHPQHGPFYLLQGLLNAIPRFGGWGPGSGCQATVYVNGLLPLLAALEQSKLPYGVKGVQCNDALYANSKDYGEALREYRGTVLNEVLKLLGELKEHASNQPPPSDRACLGKVSSLACDLMNQIVNTTQLGGEAGFQGGDKAAAFLLKLAKLANPTKQATAQVTTGQPPTGQHKYFHETMESLRKAARAAATTTASGAESKQLATILGSASAAASPPPPSEEESV